MKGNTTKEDSDWYLYSAWVVFCCYAAACQCNGYFRELAAELILITVVLSCTNSLSRTNLYLNLKKSFVYSNTFQTSFQSAVQIHDFHVWTVHDMNLRGVFLRSIDNAMSFCFFWEPSALILEIHILLPFINLFSVNKETFNFVFQY